MRRATSGYTIIEVLIVLLVSSLLLASAIALMSSLRPETEFSQGVFDIRAKIESVVRGTGNTLFPNVEQYSCATGGTGRPVLTQLPAGTTHTLGSSEACIFLGRALRVETGGGNLYIYSVLGNRTYQPSAGITEQVKSLDQALPTPALEVGADITETYSNDAPLIRLRSATADGSPATLAGFYTNLTDTSGSISRQSSFSILSMGYNFPSGLTDPTTIKNNVRTCIQGGCSPTKFSKWNLCFEDSGGNRTALISVINNASSVTTSLRFSGATGCT